VFRCVAVWQNVLQCECSPMVAHSAAQATQPCVLQRVARCCSVLQCVTVCCSVRCCSLLQRAAVCIRIRTAKRPSRFAAEVERPCVLQCVAVCCSVLQCVAVCCGGVKFQ